MRICFFGTYTIAEGYPINRVLVKGLRQAGALLEECRQELWGDLPLHEMFSRLSPLSIMKLVPRAFGTYIRLIGRYRRAPEHDAVVVGYAGHLDVLLARMLNVRRKRLIALVAFISLYDTVVLDRGRISTRSWKARLLKAIDRRAFCAADLVFVDTEAHCRYYAELFGLPSSKFRRSFVGEDEGDFQSTEARPEKPSGRLRVLFFGTYVPLHGIDTILDAAERLVGEEDVAFTLIGSGQLFPQLRERARSRSLVNVRFLGEWVSTSELVREIGRADVCLGIFGQTPKASRVIPYKVFDALAMRKPVVTMDSPAIRELLTDGETALLCESGDGESLARSLLRLRDDPDLAERLALAGHARYMSSGSPEAIGRSALAVLESLAHG